jgi:hypothetical protein
MSWSGGGLAAKLKADKEAADQAQVALAKAEAECRQTYGCGLRQHITNAMKSAVVTPEAVARERSWEGAQWTNSPAHDPHSNPSIDKYHKLEDQAKAAARGSCPDTWCKSEAPEQRWLRGQFAMTGRLTVAVSLTEPRVSRLM